MKWTEKNVEKKSVYPFLRLVNIKVLPGLSHIFKENKGYEYNQSPQCILPDSSLVLPLSPDITTILNCGGSFLTSSQVMLQVDIILCVFQIYLNGHIFWGSLITYHLALCSRDTAVSNAYIIFICLCGYFSSANRHFILPLMKSRLFPNNATMIWCTGPGDAWHVKYLWTT